MKDAAALAVKDWYSAAELAALALPDVPRTERAVQMMAKARNWRGAAEIGGRPLARRRKGRGGGWEYSVKLLPDAAQITLQTRAAAARRAASAPDGPRGSGPAHDWFDGLPEKKKARTKARAAALDSVDALVRGGLRVDDAVHRVAHIERVAASSIYAWRRLVAGLDRGDWLPALAPRHAGRSATAACDPRAWEMLKADYLRAEKPTFESCYDRVAETAAAEGWTIPGAATLRRRLRREIPVQVATLARDGADAVKRLFPHQQRDTSGFAAMDALNADGHRADVFVAWPGETLPVRPTLLAVQDIATGKIVGCRVGLTESAHLVQLAFGDVFRDFGVPEHIWLDNGRGFASKWITGQQPTRHRFKIQEADPAGLLTQLGVEVHWTTPYSGQSKPIERAFRDLCDRLWTHPAFSGAYTGNSPEAKPENYGSRAVPLEKFLEVVKAGIARHNARPGRRTQACRGELSFDEAFERSLAARALPPRMAPPAQLRQCLMAAERVTARAPSGSIHLMGNRYYAEFLAQRIGHKLTVRYDPDDLYAGVHVYRLDGSHIGFAECWEAAGFADLEAARSHNRTRRQYMRATKAMLEAEVRLTPDELAALEPPVEPPEPPQTNVFRTLHKGGAAATAPAEPEGETDEMSDEEYDRLQGAGLLRVIEGGRDAD